MLSPTRFSRYKASDITLTYSLGTTTAEGTLPASATVEVGSSYTLPVNTTLYVAGSTLTGWTDGTNTYKPGETITAPSASTTLTPVFTANTKSLADRTEATTLTYYLDTRMVPRISTIKERKESWLHKPLLMVKPLM